LAVGVTITLQQGKDTGRYVAKVEGFGGEAEMTFQQPTDAIMIIDHTRVPEAMGGRGIAKAMVRHAIADARDKGLTIIPNCSFVRAQAKKHPEWSDVILAQ